MIHLATRTLSGTDFMTLINYRMNKTLKKKKNTYQKRFANSSLSKQIFFRHLQVRSFVHEKFATFFTLLEDSAPQYFPFSVPFKRTHLHIFIMKLLTRINKSVVKAWPKQIITNKDSSDEITSNCKCNSLLFWKSKSHVWPLYFYHKCFHW